MTFDRALGAVGLTPASQVEYVMTLRHDGFPRRAS